MNQNQAVPTLIRIARRIDGPPAESVAELATEAARCAHTKEERREVIEAMQALFGEDLGSKLPRMGKADAVRFLETLAKRGPHLGEKIPVAPLIVDACTTPLATDASRRQLVTALEVLLGGDVVLRRNGEIQKVTP